jgi:hypothetical protein
MTDAFASYKFRDTCNISSLDLHVPFSPLCPDRATMLTAMSSGGRVGNDAPYTPRYCDMRWFTTEEICGILGRFEKIVLIGDSMLRHVIGSMNILIRKDLGYGAVTDWNFSAQEKYLKIIMSKRQKTDWHVGSNAFVMSNSMLKLALFRVFIRLRMCWHTIPKVLHARIISIS